MKLTLTSPVAVELSTTMNPVVGDRALEECNQAGSMTEVDKVRCHLSYALGQLQDKKGSSDNNPSHLNSVLARRSKLLSALETYIHQGNFPHHEDDEAYRQNPNARKPNFVDSQTGTPCAVAYMMQQGGSDGTQLVKQIEASHKHDTIDEMLRSSNDELKQSIESWASYNGMKVSELALIQPTYEWLEREARERARKEKIKAIQDRYNIEAERRGNECTLSRPFLDEYGRPTTANPNAYIVYLKIDVKVNEKEMEEILEKWNCKVGSHSSSRFFEAAKAANAKGAADELNEKEYVDSIEPHVITNDPEWSQYYLGSYHVDDDFCF